MEIQSLPIYDNLTKIKDFQTILTTEKNPLIKIKKF